MWVKWQGKVCGCSGRVREGKVWGGQWVKWEGKVCGFSG